MYHSWHALRVVDTLKIGSHFFDQNQRKNVRITTVPQHLCKKRRTIIRAAGCLCIGPSNVLRSLSVYISLQSQDNTL